MRHKTNSNLIDKHFIHVEAVGAGAAWISHYEPDAYHIWVPRAYSSGMSESLYVLPPRSTPDCRTFDRPGYTVRFSEEAILVLRCRHLEPFGPFNALATHKWLVIADSISHRAMVRTLEKLMEGPGRQHGCGLNRSLALLKILIVHIARQFALRKMAAPVCENSRIVERFTQLLGSRDCVRHAVKDLTEELAISPTYLNVVIRKSLGHTPNRLVQQHLLQKAKHAAIHSQESMKQVASRLGFSDMAHFSKFFSAGAGMTFTDFKTTYQHL